MRRCADCVYYESGTCRFNAPSPGVSMADAEWPLVAPNDWCAEGFNHTDGWYDPAPHTERTK